MAIPSSAPDFEIFKYTSSSMPESLQSVPQILASSTWTHVGAPLDPDNLPASYHTWSNGTFAAGDVLGLLMPFLDFVHGLMRDTHMTHYSLSIRSQKSNSDFDIPRWHTDRRFFGAESANEDRGKVGPRKEGGSSNWKIATALVGPGTLFVKDGKRARRVQREIEARKSSERSRKGHYAVSEEHVCTSFRCLGCADMEHSVRMDMAKAVEGMETVQVGHGELVVFKVDGYNSCHGEPAMHSEPPMSTGDRVFVHVVPGKEKELRTLVEGWGLEFPKDWFIGVLQPWNENT
ncbi:hypothetical protein BJ878DRAFT_186284 [Calycina marina]|uniref:Uncharacterized protein n=1 Tax=Calycina marina TaxID=1763456 RepID=A0A9P7Z8U5_9HELO|nr:hypothetical protein BJ878DRAFT_186284 [Calycina marina]